MSRRASPTEIRTRAAAGYLTPAAVVARYGKKHGFTIQLVYKLVTRWRREQWHVGGKVAVDYDGRNAWLLRAAVAETLREREKRA